MPILLLKNQLFFKTIKRAQNRLAPDCRALTGPNILVRMTNIAANRVKGCSKNYTSLSLLKIVFVLANSADPDEMLHIAAFHQGLHCLLKYPFIGFNEFNQGLYKYRKTLVCRCSFFFSYFYNDNFSPIFATKNCYFDVGNYKNLPHQIKERL